MKQRTSIDFSKHEMIITESNELQIFHLKIPNTNRDSIKYTNTGGVLVVTGDYGNWIFCRCFAPDAKGSVSEQYWIEKLKHSSCQDPYDYSSDYTTERLNERILEIKDWGHSDSKLKDATEHYTDLLNYTDDYYEYISKARDYPSFMDLESALVIGLELKYWLKAVFDGFEEMCKRMENEELSKAA